MDIKIDFQTMEERNAVIAEQQAKGLRLKKEQYHFDGKHLIFTDEPPETPPPPQRNLAQEIDNLIAILKTRGII